LIIVHAVAEGFIGPSKEVLVEVDRSLVEGSVPVSCVTSVFVSINQPINECNDGVLEGDPGLGLGIEVEWHVVIPLYAHELVIQI